MKKISNTEAELKRSVAYKKSRVNYEHFGPLLVPVILEKLPNTVKLQISRKLAKENWNIVQFLSAINQEISARGNFEYLKQNSSDSKEEEKNYMPKQNWKSVCFLSVKTIIANNAELLPT